jgi:RHS repeat-associated protein
MAGVLDNFRLVFRFARGEAFTTFGGVASTFTVDAADRVTGVSKTGSTVGYVVDELDRTKTRTLNGVATAFSYSGFETDPAAQGTDVLFARGVSGELLGDRLSTGLTHSIGSDGHGDATHWYNAATSAVTDSKQYDPFGAVTSAVTLVTGSGAQLATTGFQGDWTDPTTGDVNMGARWYTPGTGTFRTRDTYFGQLSTPFSLNRYTYGLNSPLRYSDPMGHAPIPAGCGNACQAEYAQRGIFFSDHPLTENDDGTPNPGAFATTVPNSSGGETIVVVSASGIAVSSGSGTERSGNLTYTPDESLIVAAKILVRSGFGADSIAAAAADAFSADAAKPGVLAIVSSAVLAIGGDRQSEDSPSEPTATGATFYGQGNPLEFPIAGCLSLSGYDEVKRNGEIGSAGTIFGGGEAGSAGNGILPTASAILCLDGVKTNSKTAVSATLDWYIAHYGSRITSITDAYGSNSGNNPYRIFSRNPDLEVRFEWGHTQLAEVKSGRGAEKSTRIVGEILKDTTILQSLPDTSVAWHLWANNKNQIKASAFIAVELQLAGIVTVVHALPEPNGKRKGAPALLPGGSLDPFPIPSFPGVEIPIPRFPIPGVL